MQQEFLITINDKPVCLSDNLTIIHKLKDVAKNSHNSYVDFIIYHILSNGVLYKPFKLSIGFKETGYKFFLNQKMVDESVLVEILSA